jgi:cell division protein ZapE
MGEAKTVAERYAAALAASGGQPEAAQLHAVARLDALREQLLRAPKPPASRLARWRERLGWTRPPPLAPPRGLYLHGDVGRGKTFLMDLFHASLGELPARRDHFNRFMQHIHARLQVLDNTQDPLVQVANDVALEARVLCFDELHVNDIGDAMLLGGLFSALVAAGTTLVFTSNVPPAGLYRDGLQRVRFLPAIALLERHCELVTVDGGQDYRLRALERAPLYLDSEAASTTTDLAERFWLLTGARHRAGALCINGRDIAVHGDKGDTAWFSFQALCEGPRGQTDYIELARSFSTVFLTDIPVLSDSTNDAARRLVSLVDEFYDRGVKLVVSAAAPPTTLYTGERLAFEFQRTASRLIEMQSHDYLARPHRP